MQNPYAIIISGIPAGGKTTFAKYISDKLRIPFLCKDHIKECLYDSLYYDTGNREEMLKYGIASYNLFYQYTETLMKAGVPLVMESNFDAMSRPRLLELVSKYHYRTINIKFDGDLAVIHKRFIDRDTAPERHKGLVSNNFYNEFSAFRDRVQSVQDFSIGGKEIIVDATDFAQVDYEELYRQIREHFESA